MALDRYSNAIYITGEAGRFFVGWGIPDDTFRFIERFVSFYFFLTFRFANYTPDRFVIKLRKENSLEEQLDDNDRFAYFDNGRLMVDNVSGDVVIDIYDVMGRKIVSSLTKNTDSSCSVEFEGNKTGLYIIRLSDKKGIRTQKIIL